MPAKLKIPAGTQAGTTFRLRGKGMPNVHGHGHGDEHIRVLVEGEQRAVKPAAKPTAKAEAKETK